MRASVFCSSHVEEFAQQVALEGLPLEQLRPPRGPWREDGAAATSESRKKSANKIGNNWRAYQSVGSQVLQASKATVESVQALYEMPNTRDELRPERHREAHRVVSHNADDRWDL